jgi:hypothetical protein
MVVPEPDEVMLDAAKTTIVVGGRIIRKHRVITRIRKAAELED